MASKEVSSVRVFARFRPTRSNHTELTSCDIDQTLHQIRLGDRNRFRFDGVLTSTSTQIGTFETIGSQAVVEVMNGFNATILAYGQTGSGKTHTMLGAGFGEGAAATQAAWDVYLHTIGVKPFDERARFSGRLNAKNGDMISVDLPLIKTRLYNSYNISKTTIKDYVESLNKYKPKLVEGYPSALFQLCKYILLFDLKIDFIPKAISCTAETLRIDQRQLIQEVFNCKVYNQYASSEGAPFITECKNGKYHLLLYTGLIHNVRDVEGVAVTSFRNSIIPLINYFIGDIITFKDKFLFNNEKCDCGTLMPIISNIQGRLEDTIQTKSKGDFKL